MKSYEEIKEEDKKREEREKQRQERNSKKNYGRGCLLLIIIAIVFQVKSMYMLSSFQYFV